MRAQDDRLSSLAAAAASGDAAATAHLMQIVWPDAFRIAWSVLGERTAAEDAAQEACAKVLTSIAALRDPQSFVAWFYRIVVNEAKQRVRRVRDVPLESDPGERYALEDHLDLRRALERLEPPLRTAIVLRYYAGLSSVQIAKIVGATSMTVRWRLFIARQRLRPLIGAAIPTSSLHTNRTGEFSDEPQAVR